jgi:hypothetical protein
MAKRNWQTIEEWDASQRHAAFDQLTTELGTLLSPVMYRPARMVMYPLL